MRRIKVERQTEIAECGLACLTMISNYHGAKTDLGAMREKFSPSMRGTSLKTIASVAHEIGLIPRAISLPVSELDDLHLPAILHWDMTHFVVIERVSRRSAVIHDPASGTRHLNRSALKDHFTGVALELRPSGIFSAPPVAPRLKLRQLWTNMTGLSSTLSQIVVASALIEIFSLASPFYLQVGVDVIEPTSDVRLLIEIGIIFIIIAILQGALSLSRAVILARSGCQIGFGLSNNIFRHLLRLPVSWYQKRMLGDMLTRVRSVDPVQELLSRGSSLAIVQGVFAILTLVMMFFYSLSLTLILVLSTALALIARGFMATRQTSAEQSTLEAYSKEQTTIIECLRGIISIRMLGMEGDRHQLWQNQRSDVVNFQAEAAIYRSKGEAIASSITDIEQVISIWLGIILVIRGYITIGMLFAFFTLKAMFATKARFLLEQLVQLRMVRLSLDRIGDIALCEEDSSFSESISITENESFESLELRDLTFRYSLNDPTVLDKINLKIEKGDRIAITGPSGGGKSTLIRVILGLSEPSSGSIYVNGKPLKEFGIRRYHKLIAAVLQEDSLFTGTLADNISMFAAETSTDSVAEAACAAAIAEDIERMPMRYNTLTGDMGSILSSGQRQRILIARAIYRNPAVLVMDESTSHLDSERESAIAKNLDQLNLTRITVAHRNETLRHATSRYRLDRGKLFPEPREAHLDEEQP